MFTSDNQSFDEFRKAVRREAALVTVRAYFGGASRSVSLLSALDIEGDLWVGNQHWMASVKRSKALIIVQLLREGRTIESRNRRRKLAIARSERGTVRE
jgi:hypothetical protein